MKRIGLLFLILALSLSFCACDEKDKAPVATPETTTAATTAAATTAVTTAATTVATTASPTVQLPGGNYKAFYNEDIGFAYPSHWLKQEGSVTLLVPANGGNNITVAYEPKTELYKNMTLASFETIFKPALQSMGVNPVDPSVEQVVNNKGVPMTRISYKTVQSGVEMTQTLLILTVGERTYSITVTVVALMPDEALVNNVFQSMLPLK